jgi:hypothetical protein
VELKGLGILEQDRQAAFLGGFEATSAEGSDEQLKATADALDAGFGFLGVAAAGADADDVAGLGNEGDGLADEAEDPLGLGAMDFEQGLAAGDVLAQAAVEAGDHSVDGGAELDGRLGGVELGFLGFECAVDGEVDHGEIGVGVGALRNSEPAFEFGDNALPVGHLAQEEIAVALGDLETVLVGAETGGKDLFIVELAGAFELALGLAEADAGAGEIEAFGEEIVLGAGAVEVIPFLVLEETNAEHLEVGLEGGEGGLTGIVGADLDTGKQLSVGDDLEGVNPEVDEAARFRGHDKAGGGLSFADEVGGEDLAVPEKSDAGDGGDDHGDGTAAGEGVAPAKAAGAGDGGGGAHAIRPPIPLRP